LETLPREWIAALRFVQAVMVPSRFCQAVVQRYTSKPVLVVPHPVRDAPVVGQTDRENRSFRVVGVFSFGSSFVRKNPVALVDSFRRAFGDDPACELVLKTSYGARYEDEKAKLLAKIGESANIRLVDDLWTERQVAELIGSASLYASLHRSEGFGLPIAEAIMAGTPVLATAWSGNTEFCSADDYYPVNFDLVPLVDSHSDYQQIEDARWAEPSTDHAVAQLRRARAESAGTGKIKARSAKRALQSYLSLWNYERALAVLESPQRSAPNHEHAGRQARRTASR
jgi:glycosyltransferase involved in cell wall biosynthesis